MPLSAAGAVSCVNMGCLQVPAGEMCMCGYGFAQGNVRLGSPMASMPEYVLRFLPPLVIRNCLPYEACFECMHACMHVRIQLILLNLFPSAEQRCEADFASGTTCGTMSHCLVAGQSRLAGCS